MEMMAKPVCMEERYTVRRAGSNAIPFAPIPDRILKQERGLQSTR